MDETINALWRIKEFDNINIILKMMTAIYRSLL